MGGGVGRLCDSPSMGSNGQGNNSGASMGAREVSPKTRARDARKRQRQAQSWADRSGPVTVIRPADAVEDDE